LGKGAVEDCTRKLTLVHNPVTAGKDKDIDPSHTTGTLTKRKNTRTSDSGKTQQNEMNWSEGRLN